jgi:hypothetical protein
MPQNSSRPSQRQPGHEVVLDLRRHCIETACRRQYNRAVSGYFGKSPDHRRLERDIDLLQKALETVDFGELRRLHVELAGGYAGPVALGLDHTGRFVVRFGSQQVRIQSG